MNRGAKMLGRRAFGRGILPAAAALAGVAAWLRPAPAAAATRAEIDRDVAAALVRLRGMDNARPLFGPAKAVLVFPRIISGGFIVGGQYGEGAVVQNGANRGYYNIAGVSLGLLAGAQAAGLAMFFMTEEAIAALMRADGWEVGTGPTVVALDRGLQANITSSTLTEPVYAITFGQEGLMAALALNGTKISRITRTEGLPATMTSDATDGLDDEEVRAILLRTRRVAVVGASDRPGRPSLGVFGFLLARGYDAVPVNPALAGRPVAGVPSVGSLADAAPLDLVDVFRRSDEAGAAVDEAIALGARTVWLQLGVVDRAAGERARAAGLSFVMNRCPAIEWGRLRLPARVAD